MPEGGHWSPQRVAIIEFPDMKALDHMSLLKFDDGWRIVVKAYEASTPAQGG